MITWAITEGKKARQQGKYLKDNPYLGNGIYMQAQSWQWGWENCN